MNLPDFMIIGSPRCGTSSLFMTLAEHPQIQRPLGEGMENKEPGYFSRPLNEKRGLDWYKSLFPERKPGCLLFEATISSMWYPERVKLTLPDVKAIFLMRNPTVRAWGYFLFKYHHRPPHDSIDALTNKDPIHRAVERGVYVDMIKKWHTFFPRENLLTLKSEDWFFDPHRILKQVYDFLEIDEIYPPKISRADPWDSYGWKKGLEYPKIPKDIKIWLDNFYHPHNKALEGYLGRKFHW